jgi:MraZ protein
VTIRSVVQNGPDKTGVEDPTNLGALDYPHGIASAKVDDKGRCKLPAAFHQYLTKIGASKVFVTSFDELIGRVYPTPVWNQVVARLSARGGEDVRERKEMLFLANDIGDDAEVDQQGRFLVPSKMRKAMEFESATVYLEFQDGYFKLFGSEVYEQMKRQAAENRAEKLRILEEKGVL